MNAMKKLITAIIVAAFLVPLLYGCGSNVETTETDGTDTSGIGETGGMITNVNKAHNIFYAIPSPIELAQLIQKAGANYNKDLLNSPNNVNKYNTNISKALNLGIYGADLSYTSVFDNNTQESIIYLACTHKLAESLGVGNAFDEKIMNRMQANTGKKDSLLTIISSSYLSTDEMLKENQRENASALVITGGFIEALYLGTQLAKNTKNNSDIITRIAEQKGTLNNVVNLLSSYEEEAGIAEVLTGLKELKAIYDQVTVTSQSAVDVKTNSTTKVTTIGGKITYSIAPEVVEKLTSKAAEIRNKIIAG